MNKNMPHFITILILVSMFVACTNSKQRLDIALNQASTEAELFAEDIISTSMYERDMAISPDGNEIIYTLGDYKQKIRCLVSLTKTDDQWSTPSILPFTGSHSDIEPFITTTGNHLFFASNRPINKEDDTGDYNIWISEKTKSGWSEPIALDTTVNKEGDEYYPSVALSGNLYFTSSRANGIGSEDIFISKLIDGNYTEAEVLDTNINTSTYEFNAYINPSEDMLIFSSYGRADGLGGGDLYISQKDEQGHWQASRNLGPKINSEYLDFCPFVDHTNRVFYFTSDRMDSLKTRIDSYNAFYGYSHQTLNGMGNIYRISFDNIMDK